jgi:hypothetical protein
MKEYQENLGMKGGMSSSQNELKNEVLGRVG